MLAIVLYNKIILTKSYSWVRNLVFRHRYESIQRNYINIQKEKQEKARRNEVINVAFFMWETSKWKYEGIYRLLEQDKRFFPYIIITPFSSGATVGQNYIAHMKDVYSFFLEKEYNVFIPLEGNDVWNQIEEHIAKPDIIFYMNCWHEYGEFIQFGHRSNLNVLQAYVPYAWMISNRYIEHFNRDFHNCMWKIFYETPLHVEMAKKYAINKGINAVATGYPLLDVFFDKDYKPKDIWKKQSHKKKRIIWAPHHHMLEKNRCANFLYICDEMVELAKRYQDQVQFVFKPHPELAKKLDNCIPGWNEEKRKVYFKQWEEMPNTQVCLDEYIDLFLTSDAMIQDCGSFTAEYTCTYKPMLFLMANDKVVQDWNECGKEILRHIYVSERGKNIQSFIENVVIGDNDYMKDERIRFVDTYLKPEDKEGASMAIYNYLRKELDML